MKCSVLIPARNEALLGRTIKEILRASRGDVEVIAVLDGYVPDPPLVFDDRVKFIFFVNSIGQRAAVNEAARAATGEFLIKTDGHSMFSDGWDLALQSRCEADWTVLPRMYNLHAFDWVCGKCGKRQDNCAKPEKCDQCGCTDHVYDEIFKCKTHKVTDFMFIDQELRARYFDPPTTREFGCQKAELYHRRPEAKGDIADVMTGQGACWAMRRDRFWALGGLDEAHGSWGQMGVEIACKSWLSGGRQVVDKSWWFAHLFRTQPNFKFPYPIRQREIDAARAYSRDLWTHDKWPLAKRTFKWLLEKFSPVPGWNMPESDLTVLYYTANAIDESFADKVRGQIMEACRGNPIISISQKPIHMGNDNICVGQIGQSLQNVYRQVLEGCRSATTPYVALVEDDCLYVPEHFKHRPKGRAFAYNKNRWNCHVEEVIFSTRARAVLSQCIAPRDLLIECLEKRLALPSIPDELCGEPGIHEKALGLPTYKMEFFETKDPNLIICHSHNTTGRKYVANVTCDRVEPWGSVAHIVNKYMKGADAVNTPPSVMKMFSQRSRIGGKPDWPVEDLWVHRESLDHERSLHEGMPPMWPALESLVTDLVAGKTFTDDEIRQTPYYEYRLACLNPVDRIPTLTGKGERQAVERVRDTIDLFYDIKQNGLKAPLTFYRLDGRWICWRGKRRLVIIHGLGYKTVPIRVFKGKMDAHRFGDTKLFDDMDHERDLPSIHDLAIRQFNEHGGLSTDKYWVHGYTRHYDRLFAGLRLAKLKILEFGVYYGASLRLWHDAFPNARIFGADKDKSRWETLTKGLDRVKVMRGMQEDAAFLQDVVVKEGPFDIIIDDCGHKPQQQLVTFNAMWPHLNKRGWYVIEDCWHSYETGNKGPNIPRHFAGWVDKLYDHCDILEMHQWYNLLALKKGIGK